MKFHTGASAVYAGINCHWQTHHPTKERLMSLQLSSPGIARRLAGRCLVAVLAAGAMAATLAAAAWGVACPARQAASAAAMPSRAAKRVRCIIKRDYLSIRPVG